ncbi:exosortase family protein XrtM [Paucibacter sp. XJ19-41]|uniref:exosortase family protein XrtM n=1 Tax=Paucibacter sp. XJ19-41 TaxID=2927824 RepID=UPI0023498F3B|nr:exosortase family protein XrtM [Paucibacter sp. XJ19-41]MDC6168857.1 exosortase family protein XrtM [Paucibacter sp. XJ19-41]
MGVFQTQRIAAAMSRAQARPWIALVLFVGVYASLHGLYMQIPDELLRELVHYYAIVWPSAGLISLIAPADQVAAQVGAVVSPTVSLSIIRGCDGSGALFLLLAAVAAARGGVRHKLLGLAGAVLVSYVLNEARVVSLYFVAAHRAGWFDTLHNFLIPTLVVLLSCFFFLWWAGRLAPRSTAGANHAS